MSVDTRIIAILMQGESGWFARFARCLCVFSAPVLRSGMHDVGNMTASRDVMIATRMIDWSLCLVPVLQSPRQSLVLLVTSHEDSDYLTP
jgi:hypothetical protein